MSFTKSGLQTSERPPAWRHNSSSETQVFLASIGLAGLKLRPVKGLKVEDSGASGQKNEMLQKKTGTRWGVAPADCNMMPQPKIHPGLIEKGHTYEFLLHGRSLSWSWRNIHGGS